MQTYPYHSTNSRSGGIPQIDTRQPNTALDPRLIKRGIASAAAHQQWEAGPYGGYDGWFVPFFDAHGKPLINPANKRPIRAHKTAPGQGPDAPHDRWEKGTKPEGLKPLLLPITGIIRAIQQTNGLVYLVEGHADFLTMLEAGHDNVIGIPGKGFVPDNLAEQLLSWHTTHLIVYCHPDAIQAVGQTVVNLLHGSGITVTIYRLITNEAGHKIDVNDLWQLARFDRAVFEARLAALQRLDLTPEPVRQYTPKTNTRHLTADDRPRLKAWANAALDGEAEKVAQASAGNRFNVLKAAANRLGTIAAHDLLDRTECENALIAACYSNGYITANERTARAQFKCYFDKGLPHPCELPPADLPSAHTDPRPAVDLSTLCWQPTLHDSLERAILRYAGKQGKAIAQTLRAILETYPTGDFDLQTFTDQTSIPYLKAYRVMENYGLWEVMREPAPTDENIRLNSILPDQEKESDQGTVHSDIIQLYSQKTSRRYRLPTYAVFMNWFLQRYVWPRLVEEVVKLTEGYAPEFSAELARAIGTAPDAATIRTINERLAAARTPERNRQLQALWNGVNAQFEAVRLDLQDLICTPLPDSQDWRKHYVEAVVEREVIPYVEQGKQCALDRLARQTGLSRSTIRRTYERIDLVNEEVYHPTGQVIDHVDALPEPGQYDPRFAGAPARVVFETGEMIDYRADGVLQKAAAALGNGERVKIDYRQAGIPRRMTPEEITARQVARDQQAAERLAARAAAHQDKPLESPSTKQQSISEPPHVGPGHTPRYAQQAPRVMLAELGYTDTLGYTLYGGNAVALKPLDKLNGAEMVKLLKGESLIAQDDVLARHGIPRGQPIKFFKLYNVWYSHREIAAALPPGIQETLQRCAADEIDIDLKHTIVIGEAA